MLYTSVCVCVISFGSKCYSVLNCTHHHHHIRFWYLWCCGCPGLRGRQHLATPHTRTIVRLLPPPRRLCDRCCLFVILWAVLLKNNKPISLKLDVIIRPTNGKSWLTFGGDLILIRIPDHFFISFTIMEWGFRIFISNSLTVASRFLQHLGKLLMLTKNA